MPTALHPELAPRYGYQPRDLNATPVVSIVTPFYNTGSVFLETVDSILRQSLQQWEWVIVNDGSTDPVALRTLLALRSADCRIRVLDTPNRGLPIARNTGAAATSAPLLFFLDSDDLLAPTAIEKLVWSLVSRPESAFAGGWNAVFGSQNALSKRGFDTRHSFPFDNAPLNASLVRRTAFDTVGGFHVAARPEFGGLEDFDFWVRAAAVGLWGFDIHEYLVLIRRKAAREYTSYQWAFQNNRRLMAEFRADVQSRYPELMRTGPPVLPDPTADAFPRISAELPFANLLEPVGDQRILMLLPGLVPGGADRVALDLAAGLVEEGQRVSVALTRDMEHGWMPDMQAITPDVFDLPAFLAPADIPRFLCYLLQSRAITHVLISNSILAYELLPFLRAYCPDVTYLDFVHAEQPQRHGGFARVSADHDQLLDLHLVTSDHLRRYLVELGASADRVEVDYIGAAVAQAATNDTVRSRVRRELGIRDDTALILFVGRLSSEKRPLLAAEILRDLAKRNVGFQALFAGDGEQRRAVRRFIRQNRLASVIRLLGNLPHSRIQELLGAADLLLLPSEREGIAVTLFEALAAGVVPVAAAVGGQAEVVTPAVGTLITRGPNEREAYVDALAALIENPNTRRTMAAAGRERAQAFTTAAFIRRTQTLLDAAARRRQTQPRPPVPVGAGLAAATLAIEHDQLERRLRRFVPVRAALAWRWTPLGRAVSRLAMSRSALSRLDRRIYATRRILGDSMRALLRRG